MKFLNRFLLAFTCSALFLSTGAFAAFSESNAAFDYAYTADSLGELHFAGNALNQADGKTLDLFSNQDLGQQTIYFGMKTPFDRMVFNVEKAVVVESGFASGLAWEYFNGMEWKALPVSGGQSHLNLVGTQSLDFELPMDWMNARPKDMEMAYWVRVKNVSTVLNGGLVDVAGARAYNVQLQLNNDFGDPISNLQESDFQLYHGSNNTLYGVKARSNGMYWLAVETQGEEANTMLVVKAPGYLDKGIYIEAVEGTIQSYTNTLEFEGVCLLPFNDLEFTWMKPAVRDLYCRQVLILPADRSFDAASFVSRADFIKMLVKNAEANELFVEEFFPEGTDLTLPMTRGEAVVAFLNAIGLVSNAQKTHFTDVSPVLIPYVELAYRYSLIEGYSDGTFRPETPITLGETVMMFYNGYNIWYRG